MSQHSSLKIDPTRTRHRNVLKRHERIQRLIETEKWNDRPSAFGLPKVRSMKIKVKKVKEKPEGAEAAKATAAPAGAAAPAAASAPAADKKKAASKK